MTQSRASRSAPPRRGGQARILPGGHLLASGRTWILLGGLAVGGVIPAALAGQPRAGPQSLPAPVAIQSAVAPVPFGPGESAQYEVRLGRLSIGRGSMEVLGVEAVRGRPSYHVSWRIEGGLPLLRVRDHFQTWMDVTTLATRRFIQDIDEVRYERLRHYEIYPEEKRWELLGTGDAETFTTDRPLDDISFIYYVRTLPSLEVGRTYTLHQYFREDRNPVILNVLRTERIDVPAGTFDTIVIQPIIQSGGLFGEGGNAELYFTDDEERLLVRMVTRGIPLLGNLSLHLTSVEPSGSLND